MGHQQHQAHMQQPSGEYGGNHSRDDSTDSGLGYSMSNPGLINQCDISTINLDGKEQQSKIISDLNEFLFFF